MKANELEPGDVVSLRGRVWYVTSRWQSGNSSMVNVRVQPGHIHKQWPPDLEVEKVATASVGTDIVWL